VSHLERVAVYGQPRRQDDLHDGQFLWTGTSCGQAVYRFFHSVFDVGQHADYDALVARVMSAITDPAQLDTYSTPEQIADVVCEAATDGKDQLRYLAGDDAKATYSMRLQLGDESFRNAMAQRFLGVGARG